jgi:hypothetical protein
MSEPSAASGRNRHRLNHADDRHRDEGPSPASERLVLPASQRISRPTDFGVRAIDCEHADVVANQPRKTGAEGCPVSDGLLQ